MISFDVFLLGLMIVSTLTSLATEAIKKILTEHKKTCHSNTLVGIVATVLSVGVGCGYIVLEGLVFNSQTVMCIIALMFMSWLCSMVGYDKVVDAIKATKNK